MEPWPLRPEAVATPTSPTAAFTLMEGLETMEEGRPEPQAPQENRFDPGRRRTRCRGANHEAPLEDKHALIAS